MPPAKDENLTAGIDIGSTSTKATLMNSRKVVVAGLYTSTGGQPVAAVQKLTRTIEALEKRFGVAFSLIADGTTGSGRKFIQNVARADYGVDEITAHAAAAYHLNPEIDTIIEIGGQDAKFTVMNNGMATFSVMNYVCAAGAGSFIEEQAQQLGIALNEYAHCAEGHSAPMISDQCTVFMQRDLHYLLSLGYSRGERNTSNVPSLKIGLYATLTMLEYLPLWELFFKRLGFTTVVSPVETGHIAAGKEIAGADYCAPITDLHGHIRYLASRVDYIFFPQLFENANGNEEKAYCYYCHYAVPIVQNIPGLDISKKMIAPVLDLHKDINETIRTVYLHLPEELKTKTTFAGIEAAFIPAWDRYKERKADMQYLFLDQVGASNDIGIVLIGRPYLILHRALNKGIPDKLAEMGIQSFFMDMVPIDDDKLDAARDFVRYNHWHYGNRIIKKRLAEIHFQTHWQCGRYIALLKDKVAFNMLNAFNKKLNIPVRPVIDNRVRKLEGNPCEYLQKNHFTIRHSGETSKNLLKVYYLRENYPELKLIINVYPIFCCPGLISEAIYRKVEKEIGIPIVSITYDGTQADKNKVLNPYLYFLK